MVTVTLCVALLPMATFPKPTVAGVDVSAPVAVAFELSFDNPAVAGDRAQPDIPTTSRNRVTIIATVVRASRPPINSCLYGVRDWGGA